MVLRYVTIPILLALASSSVARAEIASAAPVPPPPVATPSSETLPPPPSAVPPVPASTVTPEGQWVHTSQYGWVYMPYARAYTYVPAESGTAYVYAYYPAAGWSWVYAPWVLRVGPAPFWGPHGRVHFSWYAHPWFRVGPAPYHPGARVFAYPPGPRRPVVRGRVYVRR